jgi:hypothetical protein
VAIQDLEIQEIEEVSGGLPWTTPAMVALADTASLGPLVWAFGIGYTIGTVAYYSYRSNFGY